MKFFLGNDWLYVICGLESTTSEYACIWCKCPQGKHWDMDEAWSVNGPRYG